MAEKDKTDTLTVTNLWPLDGVYEFDLAELMSQGTSGCLTHGELHKIKLMTGIRRGEMVDALTAGDTDLDVAIAYVILSRHGKQPNEASMWAAPGGTFAFDFYEREDADAVPPAPSENENSSRSDSGDDTTTLSASRENGQSRTGSPGSERSLAFDLPTSET